MIKMMLALALLASSESTFPVVSAGVEESAKWQELPALRAQPEKLLQTAGGDPGGDNPEYLVEGTRRRYCPRESPGEWMDRILPSCQ